MNVRLNKAQVFSACARAGGCRAAADAAGNFRHAGPNEQAKRIYERIAGDRRRRQCSADGDRDHRSPGRRACWPPAIATSAPSFYNVTLKNW